MSEAEVLAELIQSMQRVQQQFAADLENLTARVDSLRYDDLQAKYDRDMVVRDASLGVKEMLETGALRVKGDLEIVIEEDNIFQGKGIADARHLNKSNRRNTRHRSLNDCELVGVRQVRSRTRTGIGG